MSKKTKRTESSTAERIAVDYPHEGEILSSAACTFLIDAPARGVEIAVDGDDWLPCRRGDGYWRHDSLFTGSGRHQAVVRCAGSGDAEPAILVRRFVVE
jgi:hypothetical protein